MRPMSSNGTIVTITVPVMPPSPLDQVCQTETADPTCVTSTRMVPSLPATSVWDIQANLLQGVPDLVEVFLDGRSGPLAR